jgi:metal-sulfur cluster biosynthetic enzyme
MFLMTRDEIDAACTEPRYETGLTAPAYAIETPYEARAGKSLEGDFVPALPLAVAEGLKTVFDPELPVNIYDLGLVYDIHVSPAGDVCMLASLTSPNCPAAGFLPQEMADAASVVPGVGRVGVSLTFDVPWNPDMMSEIAKVELGLF